MSNDSILSQSDINNQSSHLNKRYEPVILQPHEIIPLNAPLAIRHDEEIVEPKQSIRPDPAGVYIIRRLDLELWKIGCANFLERRIKQVQQSIKAFTVLEHKIIYPRSFALETALHHHFSTKHVGGEWFHLTADDLKFIQNVDPDAFLKQSVQPRIPKPRKPRRRNEAIDARNAELHALRAAGMTLQEIGDQYGLSRERVRQILAQRATPTNGGAS
jgi:DNA-binding CsgD family transcriptional regulator